MIGEGGVWADVGVEADEAVFAEGDGWAEEGEEGVGHVVGARAEVCFGVDDAVVSDGYLAE